MSQLGITAAVLSCDRAASKCYDVLSKAAGKVVDLLRDGQTGYEPVWAKPMLFTCSRQLQLKADFPWQYEFPLWLNQVNELKIKFVIRTWGWIVWGNVSAYFRVSHRLEACGPK